MYVCMYVPTAVVTGKVASLFGILFTSSLYTAVGNSVGLMREFYMVPVLTSLVCDLCFSVHVAEPSETGRLEGMCDYVVMNLFYCLFVVCDSLFSSPVFSFLFRL